MAACPPHGTLSGPLPAMPGVSPWHRARGYRDNFGPMGKCGGYPQIPVDGSLLNLVWTYPYFLSTTFSF